MRLDGSFWRHWLSGSFAFTVLANLGAAPLTWIPGPTLNEPRGGAAAVLAPSGGILVFGGSPVGSTNVLVLGGNNAQALPATRLAPGAIALGGGQFLVFGGRRTNSTSGALGSTLTYNPVPSGLDDPNVFTVAALAAARSDFAFTSDAQGRGYAIGGLANNNVVLPSVERYDPVSNAWTTLAPLPSGRFGFSAAFDGTNTIYTFGGRTNATTGSETTTGFAYDIDANSWSAFAPLPVGVVGAAVIRGADGRYYVIGGKVGGMVTNLVQVYDAMADSWQFSSPMPIKLTGASGVADASGHLVLIGGLDEHGTELGTTWVSQQLNQPDTAPVFTTSSFPAATYLVPYSAIVTAVGNPQPAIQLVSGPTGMEIDPYTGKLTWTPQADQMGSNVITLRATNYAGSADLTLMVNAIGPTPSPPTNVVASEIAENSVTLKWDPVIPVVGEVTYQIYYRHVITQPRGSSHAVYDPLLGGLSSPLVTITGLAAGSSHTYAVAAVAAGASSGLSQNVSITTLEPLPPVNLRVTGLTSTSITLAWDPPSGPIPLASYEVWGWINNGVTSTIYGTTNTELTITGLTPGTAHEWGVRGRDAEGIFSGFDYGPTIVNPIPAPATLTADLASQGGAFQFTVQSGAPQTFLVQATSTPEDPHSWATIATLLPVTTSFTFTDPDSGGFAQRFYRVVTP